MKSLRLLLWLGAGTLTLAANSEAQVAASKKKAEAPSPSPWRAGIELRHHLLVVREADSDDAKQEPTAHARLQIGARLYDGLAELYGTLGVYKSPQTRQVLQRRPEFAVDLRPIQEHYFELMQYNLVLLPFAATQSDPEALETEASQGSVYVVGVAPSFKLPWQSQMGTGLFRLGVDSWTKLYSRRQYTSDYQDDGESELDQGRLSLSGQGSSDRAAPEAIEDTAPHYDSQAMLGLAFSPASFAEWRMGITGHMHSSFSPRYVRDQDGGVSYDYAVERYSFLKLGWDWQINERTTMSDEFIHYYDYAFQGERGDDRRRMRNTLKLAVRL